MENVTITPKKYIRGEIEPPGDKSISHRSVMLASLADGKSVIENFLDADDCLSTVNSFKSMGVDVNISEKFITINGVGLNGLRSPKEPLYLGNSGTTMRLLSGILSAQNFETILMGDESLQSRPMDRIIKPLGLMGASIKGNGKRQTAPLTIMGSKLHGIEFEEVYGSAQVKSSILLAGMYADGKTIVHETKISRDHTERMLKLFNAPFKKENNICTIKTTEYLNAKSFLIPGDISSASFFIVAAILLKNSELIVKNVGLNPTRLGFITVLKKMGANIDIRIKNDDFEPTGNIIARSSSLKGIKIEKSIIPLLIDELPIIMVAASYAEGETVIQGAQELRVKETDRIKSMSEGLNSIGAKTKETEDGLIIQGCSKTKGKASVDSYDDHRTAMSLAIAALNSDDEVNISNTRCVSISYPKFFETLKLLSE